MIRCDQLLAELSELLDDEIAVSLRREIEAHLAECRTCSVLYDSSLKTLRIVTESRSFDLPEGLSGRMIASIMKKIGNRPAD